MAMKVLVTVAALAACGVLSARAEIKKTGVALNDSERARLAKIARAQGRKPEQLALEYYLAGIAEVEKRRSAPAIVNSAPPRTAPARAADGVKVADGSKVMFFGDYHVECGKFDGNFVPQTLRGLVLAGVRDVKCIMASGRWEQSEKMRNRLATALKAKPDWVVFNLGPDDWKGNPKRTPEFTQTNVTAMLDMLVASGARVVVLTNIPDGVPRHERERALNDFLRAEAKRRGLALADVDAAIGNRKELCGYNNFAGSSVVAKAILAEWGVNAEIADYVKDEMSAISDSGAMRISTTAEQFKHADEVLGAYGRRPRDIVVTMMDEDLRAAWARLPACPHRVANMPCAKDNPRNGEGDFLRLKDGRILLVYTEYRGSSHLDDGLAHLVKRVSADGGETWSDPVEAVPRTGKQNDMSVSLLRMKDGRIGLFFLRKNSGKDCMPVVRYSSDEGETWGPIVECLPAADRAYYVLNNARAERLRSGRIVLPLARHNPADGQHGRLSCAVSDDDGKTWRHTRTYEPPKDEKGQPVALQEPGVVELKDGRLYLYARTFLGRQWQAFSKDGGETWDEFGPSPIFGPRGPATIKRLSSGKLLLVWNDHEGHPEYAKIGPKWLVGTRAPLTIAVSDDEGRSWTNRKTIESDIRGFFCYFAALETDDAILLHYYNQPYLAGGCVTKVPKDWFLGRKKEVR